MPLIYGEGKNSFRMLQEEILRTREDYTLFAWGQNWSGRKFHIFEDHIGRLLAESPGQFTGNGTGVYSGMAMDGSGLPKGNVEHHPPSLTSRGLRICLPLREISTNNFEAAVTHKQDSIFCVVLKKYSESSYCKLISYGLTQTKIKNHPLFQYTSIYVMESFEVLAWPDTWSLPVPKTAMVLLNIQPTSKHLACKVSSLYRLGQLNHDASASTISGPIDPEYKEVAVRGRIEINSMCVRALITQELLPVLTLGCSQEHCWVFGDSWVFDAGWSEVTQMRGIFGFTTRQQPNLYIVLVLSLSSITLRLKLLQVDEAFISRPDLGSMGLGGPYGGTPPETDPRIVMSTEWNVGYARGYGKLIV